MTRRDTAYRAIVLFFSAAALGLAPQAHAQAAPGATGSSRPIVLPLEPYADTPLKAVAVTMGGKTVPFLFDTGGGLTVVTPEAADTLGCTPFGQVTGFRADGEKITEKRCGPVALRIGAYGTTDEVGVFDLMGMIRKQVEHARKAGRDVPMPPTIGGLVGLSSFKGRIVTLDYAHDRIVVETPASARARIRSMQPVAARVVTEASGSMNVLLQARAQTGTLWLQVDSGNNGPTFLSPHAAAQLGITLPKDKQEPLDIDLIGLGKVPASVRLRPMIYDGQLGIGTIRKLVLTIDLADGRAWAELSK